MKIFRIFLLIAVLFSSAIYAQKNDPVLLNIGDQQITQSEFTAVYKKNNLDGDVMDKKSVEDYLDLYVKFKLKVMEAEALGMDTVSSFVTELGGYRDQLAQPYLIDEETNMALMEEAYQRKGEDIRASHILLKLDKNADSKDTLEVYNKILNIRNRIVNGEDFSTVAKAVSEDPSARDRNVKGRIIPGNNGDLGYFTVFDMVYPFETAAYNTEIGDVSMPVRTDYGYHLVYVANRQPAMGRVQCAHILIKYEGNVNDAQREEVKTKIAEIYNKIQNGEAFEDLAKEYSEDPGSAPKGGVLPWFGSNRMIPDFIDVVAGMKDIGEVSEPFETTFGWHIAKLIDRKEVGSFEEEKDDIKNKLARSDRSNKSVETLVSKVLKEYGYTEYKKVKQSTFAAVDSTIFLGKYKPANLNNYQKAICKIGNKEVKQIDFLNFLIDNQEPIKPVELSAFLSNKYKEFIEEEAIAYEDSQLESKYDEFRLLMQEYRDGILLFDLMDKKIWSNAIQDTTGLKTYYQENKEKYFWKERADAIIYTFTKKDQVKKAKKMADKGASVEEILTAVNDQFSLVLTTDRNKYEKDDNDVLNQVKWELGVSKTIEWKGNTVFVQIMELIPPQQKELNECRGLVISDYQNYLEDIWVKELKQKYPVKINSEVLNAIK